MCEIGELDPCTVWRETPRKARKQHKCGACSGPILPGQHYIENFNIADGMASHERICTPCIEARKVFCAEHLDDQLCDGSTFYELLTSCIADGDPESDAKWRPMLDAMNTRGGLPRFAKPAADE